MFDRSFGPIVQNLMYKGQKDVRCIDRHSCGCCGATAAVCCCVLTFLSCVFLVCFFCFSFVLDEFINTGDEFPNGRWGDSSSAAFGELSDSHFFGFQGLKNPEDRKAEWDEAPIEDKDVWEVFARYVEGKCSRQVF